MVSHITNSPQETQAIAANVAATLKPGTCIALDGQLGAGKTQFVRGLVVGLGGNSRDVSSPTFVLLNIYQTPKMPVYHLDAYRVAGADDLQAIGFSELLEQQGVVVIEWAGRVESLLPKDCIRINIEVEGESQRSIDIERTV